MKVILKVPATTANMGPGFDCLGCALTMYATFMFEETGNGLVIDGCDEKYRGADNLAYTSFVRAAKYIGREVPPLRISISTDIPVSRGLGSSATMIVGGVVAANVIFGSPLSTAEIFSLCNEIEGHPDNIAPALFGGLTASMVKDGRPYTVNYTVDKSFKFCALIPDFETSTHEARGVLPKTIDYSDAVYNVSRTALTLKALENGNAKLLSLALSDRLHEPYRAKLIRNFDVVKALALSLGAVSFFISGSGSACMCITQDENFGKLIAEKIKKFDGNWQVKMLEVSDNGVEVIHAE